jgi:regulator of sirC expression with transglutaminase-like and TPR domain
MTTHLFVVRLAVRASLACLPACLTLVSGIAVAQELGIGGSRSVYGTNPHLSEGATALMLGNYARGVELTREGLKEILTTEERTTLLSNLCAGYVGLREYDTAIVYCNRSLEIDPGNWRALQNRAAANAGLGQITRALSDVERGLELNPDSDALKLTLSIVREQAKRSMRPAANTTS